MIYFTSTKSALVDRFTQQLKPGWLYIAIPNR